MQPVIIDNKLNDADIVIIQKKTALERHLHYINDTKSHYAHIESRGLLLQALDNLKLSYTLLNLDELRAYKLSYFNENRFDSGLRPQKKLVISLGGDGTLLQASHYVGADIMLLGINSSPDSSIGHLCAVKPDNIAKILTEIFIYQRLNIYSLNRLQVSLANVVLPLALNDILISNSHPAATSRYRLSVINKNSESMQHETQFSSGLWVATAAGSTAAIASYGFIASSLNSSQVFCASREQYISDIIKNDSKKNACLNKFELDGKMAV